MKQISPPIGYLDRMGTLPEKGWLKTGDIVKFTSISGQTMRNWGTKYDFPKPHISGKIAAWYDLAEIRKWVENQRANRARNRKK
jgi:predicted DNA-binding transcriptional regulator AlpA